MKFINTIVLSLVTATSINMAQAQETPSLDLTITIPDTTQSECIPQSEMRAIATNFPQFASLANAPQYCNDDSKEWHLISSMMFMRKTQFSANMPKSNDDLFSGRFASNWYTYYIGRINRLEIEDECPKGVVAFVYGFGGKTMYVCPLALTKSFSSLDRASVMMHEARHIDGFPHITCSKGARKGIQGACDVRISDGGSYAVTVETYAQLAKYAEGIHPAMKAYSKSSAVVYADEAFENSVRINRAETLLALTNTLDFYNVNAATAEVKKLGKVADAGKIIKRGQHMIIVPTDKNAKAQYVFANDEGEIPQSPSDFITEYNAQTPDKKANLVDLHIGAQWSARVYKNLVTLICDPKSPAMKDIQLPAGQTAANLIYPTGYTREAYTAQLATETGDLFELSCANKSASIKPSTLRLDQKYTRIYKANGVVVGLVDGKLFKIEGERSSVLQTELDGSVIEIVPHQTFEFFNQ